MWLWRQRKSYDKLARQIEMLSKFLYNRVLVDENGIGDIIGVGSIKYGLLTLKAVSVDDGGILIYRGE